jgi:hypothetical protein
MTEVWKKLSQFENLYEVSNYGNFKRVGKPMAKPNIQKNGYAYVRVCINGIPKSYRLHRLVLEAFSNESNGPHVRHLNGNKCDNKIENLAWGTAKENCMDKKIHGTLRGAKKGELHHNAKLSDSDVLKINEMIKQGIQKKAIAVQYNVDPSTISHLRNRSSVTQK